MAKLTICRGLPGSGKSWWAHHQEDAWVSNRDELRKRYAGIWNYENQAMENLVTSVQFFEMRAALQYELHVICDDTNLDWRHVYLLVELAQQEGAPWVIQDFTHVPLGLCVTRDAQRPESERVGTQRIEAEFYKYIGAQ